MDLMICADESVILASGGDDQSISLFHFNIVESSSSWEVANAKQTVQLDCHSSSVKGVRMQDDVLFSTGPDQRLNLWKINLENQSISVNLSFSLMLEVSQITSIDVKKHNDIYLVCVVGQGIQIVEIQQK
eukprot:TRINITY_DN3385_c0_g1_i1.p1 TRINITY_DN3385_c0_g1~~TRINITY_DN3385_c0_g1_i1.p1  ORF type:complete len:130 (-),score=13.51 TRINITY_DN3385_c0_g1_i1:48-437(-)